MDTHDGSPESPSEATQQEEFLALLPRLLGHARLTFGACKCAVRREDAVQECVALAWKWYVSLRQRGKDVRRFPMVFVLLVARAVRCGRRLCGQERASDVLSPVAQQRRGFVVESLSAGSRRSQETLCGLVQGQEELDAYEERLHDNTVTSPADAAAFRIDFPEFLAGLTPRDRKVAMYLSLDHGGLETAARFGLSPARVSQLRRQWRQEWQTFHGEDASACDRRPTPEAPRVQT